VRKKRRIAGGHFGEVWLGKWEGIKVAIKSAKGTSREVVDALLREVEVAKSIAPHPNIVRVYGVSEAAVGGELQLLMEYCEGGGLLEWLQKLPGGKVSRGIRVSVPASIHAWGHGTCVLFRWRARCLWQHFESESLCISPLCTVHVGVAWFIIITVWEGARGISGRTGCAFFGGRSRVSSVWRHFFLAGHD
jgi:hypothetical protein